MDIEHGLFWKKPDGTYLFTTVIPEKFKDVLMRLGKKWKKPIEYSHGCEKKDGKTYRALSVCHPICDTFSLEIGETVVRGRISRLMDKGYRHYGVTVKKQVIRTETYHYLHDIPDWVSVEE